VTGKLWVLALAGLMFLAGMATQHLVWGPRSVEAASYEPYVQRFTQEFDLSPERARFLRSLLHFYQIESNDSSDLYLSALNSSLGEDLDGVAAKYRALIRDKVLPPDQRERYDRLLAGNSIDFPPR